jgi:hypothetical protein
VALQVGSRKEVLIVAEDKEQGRLHEPLGFRPSTGKKAKLPVATSMCHGSRQCKPTRCYTRMVQMHKRGGEACQRGHVLAAQVFDVSDNIEVTFGVNLSTMPDAVIASASIEANFGVTAR